MLHSMVLAVVSMAPAAPLPSRDVKPPDGPAPSLAAVVSVDPATGQVIYSDTAQRLVPETVERVVERDGKRVTEKITVYKTVHETVHRLIEIKNTKASTADGKPLSTDEALKHIAPGSVVVIFPTAAKLEPAYLKLFKAETVIVVLGGK